VQAARFWPQDFRLVTRKGRRATSQLLVVHWLADGESTIVRVGFVVSKAVGGAVNRNRVRRRLRHLVLPILRDVPGGRMVVRALPGADRCSPGELSEELRRCVRIVFR
jgi:ribonuclease P protein component